MLVDFGTRPREHVTISNPGVSGVTVGDVLIKLDEMFDQLMETTEEQDPGVRRMWFHVEMTKQEQE